MFFRLQEMLLAFNVEIGANDSINVAKLLYSDFRILLEMFQVNMYIFQIIHCVY